jgi:hypothetical protein
MRQLNVFDEIMTAPKGSIRDRLVAAIALLEGHGIASRTAFPERPEEAARLLVGEIRGRHPDATGAWVLWTRRDDRAAFDQSGELLSPLTLYCSSPDVAQATLAACIRHNIITEARYGVDQTLVIVDPASQD